MIHQKRDINNETIEELDYMQLKEEIITDINHIISSNIYKDIDAKLYSVGFDPDDYAIVIMFNEPMHGQKDTAEALADYITSHIHADLLQPNTTIQFLKAVDKLKDVYALIKAFYVN